MYYYQYNPYNYRRYNYRLGGFVAPFALGFLSAPLFFRPRPYYYGTPYYYY